MKICTLATEYTVLHHDLFSSEAFVELEHKLLEVLEHAVLDVGLGGSVISDIETADCCHLYWKVT